MSQMGPGESFRYYGSREISDYAHVFYTQLGVNIVMYALLKLTTLRIQSPSREFCMTENLPAQTMERVAAAGGAMRSELAKAIIGQEDVIEQIISRYLPAGTA